MINYSAVSGENMLWQYDLTGICLLNLLGYNQNSPSLAVGEHFFTSEQVAGSNHKGKPLSLGIAKPFKKLLSTPSSILYCTKYYIICLIWLQSFVTTCQMIISTGQVFLSTCPITRNTLLDNYASAKLAFALVYAACIEKFKYAT